MFWAYPPTGGNNFEEMKKMIEYFEEKEKKQKEKDKDTKERKVKFLGLNERELLWYLVFLSPVVGTIMGLLYLSIGMAIYKVFGVALGFK